MKHPSISVLRPSLCALLFSALAITALPSWAQGLPAEVVHVVKQPLERRIESVGNLRANESIMLRPEQSGRIEKTLFAEGEPVKQGAPLFQLDTALYEAELQAAAARVSLSKTDYERASSLLKKGVGSVQQRDSSLAQLRVDEAQLALAKTRLDKMSVQAPFSGITGLRLVSPGDYVNVGQDLVQLTDISTMKVDFKVAEIYLSELQPGASIEIEIDAMPGKILTGEIFAVAPSADQNAHNIEVRATIPNPDGTLRPGLFAQVAILVDRTDSLTIPEQAIVPQGKSFFVMRVVGDEHKIDMVEVELGQRRPGIVEILSGLNESDIIVTAGQIKLQPGMPVSPIFVDGSQTEPKSQPLAAEEK
ncbi:efflux RND transporter periplasmic adaptor subunit [Pontibacter sp. JAM-7]|uniref:efflux RND transporter periplasmic adaptor subunit n=1 Tax=Pontibacter sp. JAM-7 TaxID=3366581 RepID=UPI003AF5453C